jgi:hypothetical protein
VAGWLQVCRTMEPVPAPEGSNTRLFTWCIRSRCTEWTSTARPWTRRRHLETTPYRPCVVHRLQATSRSGCPPASTQACCPTTSTTRTMRKATLCTARRVSGISASTVLAMAASRCSAHPNHGGIGRYLVGSYLALVTVMLKNIKQRGSDSLARGYDRPI